MKIWKAIKHNSGVAVAVAICISVVVFGFSCESTTKSLTNPEQKVTRSEFNMEIEQEVDRLELATARGIADLDRQDQIKQKLFEVGSVVATGGTVNPIGVATSLLGILGIGAIVDNKRKDKVISDLKS